MILHFADMMFPSKAMATFPWINGQKKDLAQSFQFCQGNKFLVFKLDLYRWRDPATHTGWKIKSMPRFWYLFYSLLNYPLTLLEFCHHNLCITNTFIQNPDLSNPVDIRDLNIGTNLIRFGLWHWSLYSSTHYKVVLGTNCNNWVYIKISIFQISRTT